MQALGTSSLACTEASSLLQVDVLLVLVNDTYTSCPTSRLPQQTKHSVCLESLLWLFCRVLSFV